MPASATPARTVVLALAALLVAGCASIVGKATDRLATNLGSAVLNANDPATVRDGLPAYLLLLDGLLEGDPENIGTLLAAANLNGAYAGNFTGTDAARAQRLSGKALAYAKRATCLEEAALCTTLDGNPDDFAAALKDVDDARVGLMYGLAAAWAGQIQANRDDWGAVADLPKVEALLLRVVAIDSNHDGGLPLVYLGVLNSLRPEAVGGKPELGKAYFQQAIDASEGRNLYAKTLMAEFHARLVFDQELHDRLLNEVLAADPKAPRYTLMNTLAQERAKTLLESGKDYF
ncbi:MAG: TRAP transporter TatT component family protein [Silanimonas sp.]